MKSIFLFFFLFLITITGFTQPAFKEMPDNTGVGYVYVYDAYTNTTGAFIGECVAYCKLEPFNSILDTMHSPEYESLPKPEFNLFSEYGVNEIWLMIVVPDSFDTRRVYYNSSVLISKVELF